jgi:hypothetical protein
MYTDIFLDEAIAPNKYPYRYNGGQKDSQAPEEIASKVFCNSHFLLMTFQNHKDEK